MSQQSNGGRQKFVSNKKKRAKHPSNQFLVDKLVDMKRIVDLRGDPNKQGFCYHKIINSLEAYPIPVLSTTQAKLLEGVGENMASKIGIWIKEQYKDFFGSEVDQIETDMQKDLEQQINQQYEFDCIQFMDDILNEASEDREFQNNSSNSYLGNVPIKEQINSQNNIQNQNQQFTQQIQSKSALSQKFEQYRQNQNNENQIPSQNNNNLQSQNKKKPQKENFNLFQEIVSISSEDEENNLFNNDQKNTSQQQIEQKQTKKRAYKIQEGTGAWSLLIILYSLKLEQNISMPGRKKIKEHAENLQKQPIFKDVSLKNWTCLEKLVENDYIQKWNIGESENITLTSFGEQKAHIFFHQQLDLIGKNENSNQSSQNMDKIISQSSLGVAQKVLNKEQNIISISSLSQSQSNEEVIDINKYVYKNKQPSQVKKGIIKKDKILTPIKETVSKEEITPIKMQNIQENRRNMILEEIDQESQEEEVQAIEAQKKKILIKRRDIKSFRVILLIDNREKKGKNDYFFDALYKQMKIKNIESTQLMIGDFFWIIEIINKHTLESEWYPLDYIIERKQGDDLASSIVDKRYKDQIFRLKQTGIRNIHYVIEGSCSRNSVVSQQTVDNTVLSIRINQGIKVKQTINYLDSIRWISSLNNFINKQWMNKLSLMAEDQEIEFEMNYNQFEKINKRQNQLTLKDQFGIMLRNIQGAGREAVNSIVQVYKTPINTYIQLIGLNLELEKKIKFFIESIKKNNPSSRAISYTLAARIVVIFTQNYQQSQQHKLQLEDDK